MPELTKKDKMSKLNSYLRKINL